jgi:hypothetical protein
MFTWLFSMLSGSPKASQKVIEVVGKDDDQTHTLVFIGAIGIVFAYVIIWILVPSLYRNIKFFTKFVICYAILQIGVYYCKPENWKNLAFWNYFSTFVPSIIDKIANYTG